jgi:hypothetical protein
MEQLKNLFNKVKIIRRPIHKRTERGDAFDEILSMLNANLQQRHKRFTHARLGYMLQGVPTKDLYALISKMKAAKQPGAIFWLEVRPPKKKV